MTKSTLWYNGRFLCAEMALCSKSQFFVEHPGIYSLNDPPPLCAFEHFKYTDGNDWPYRHCVPLVNVCMFTALCVLHSTKGPQIAYERSFRWGNWRIPLFVSGNAHSARVKLCVCVRESV